jgi:hypothetical protein
MKRTRIEKKGKVGLNLKGLRFYVLIGVCGFLAALSIFMTIASATSGAEVANLQKKEQELTAQQRDIEANLVENLSISVLQEKSIELGFTKINNLVYVTGAASVASLPLSQAGQ